MKITRRILLKAYVYDLRKRKVLYIVIGFLVGGSVLDFLHWKSGLSDWLIILPVVLAAPFVLNSFVAFYRMLRRYCLPAKPLAKVR